MTWYTPPQLAEMFGTDVKKFHRWIESGELSAVNLAARPGQRPRYRVSSEALQEFLAGRAVQPPTQKPQRRRRRQEVPEYV